MNRVVNTGYIILRPSFKLSSSSGDGIAIGCAYIVGRALPTDRSFSFLILARSRSYTQPRLPIPIVEPHELRKIFLSPGRRIVAGTIRCQKVIYCCHYGKYGESLYWGGYRSCFDKGLNEISTFSSAMIFRLTRRDDHKETLVDNQDLSI